MIRSLGIRNIGVIANAELELGTGLIALTGETGAGKTMVLTALGLIMGERADSTRVRAGERQLFVEGRISCQDQVILDRVRDLGGDPEGDELLINRSLTDDGRSRAAISGASVPIAQLGEISSELITIHGQSDQLRLRSTANQRDALDGSSSEIQQQLSSYQQVYRQFRELEARLERMRTAGAQDRQRLEKIRADISAIEKVNPQPGELSDLSERIARLSNVESLREAAAKAYGALVGEDEPATSELIGLAKRSLDSQSDPILQALAERLTELGTLAGEIAVDLSSYISDLDADPQLLDTLMARKAELIALERNLGVAGDEILELLPKLQAELLDLDSSDEQIERLEMQLEATLSQVGYAAKSLTAAREKTALRVSERVSAELSQLAMSGASFQIAISPLSDFELSGNDRVEFLLAAHQGAEPRPIAKGASGGELSRIMLAIELVLASEKTIPTMIFDEVDAGVGGQAALELAKRLKKLSESTQVIVVTHLAQIAALADQQIRVSKDLSGSVTQTSVQELSAAEREIEIARMLSGNPDSESALMHARELLQLSH